MHLQKDLPMKGREIAETGWRRQRGEPSMLEVFRSITVNPGATPWRRFLAFVGPGYLVAVGYMDPGNWATSLAGGAQFGYALLVVALISNIMAIILQALCARLAIATGRDLAQACRDAFPKAVSWPLWAFAELAICATDLAEVIGTAIALNLLFGMPMEIGVLVTALDVIVILWLQNMGFRWVEAFIITLLGVIALCFGIQIALADPNWGEVIRGFAPTTEIVRNPQMLYLALGIIGATVMPHNLYLHSGIVQTRAYGSTIPEKRDALKWATLDSTIALMFALIVNASILVLAAASFHKTGQTEVAELGRAHELLAPLLGASIAPTLFAIALLCCGLNSTVTATMAGQIVMEGFLDIKLPSWLRRLATRLVAIVPALLVTWIYGAGETAKLLILSQVVLGLQLPFAIVPLVMFTASRTKMGELVAPRWLTVTAAVVAAIIIVLNIKLLVDLAVG
ncbi:Nramp family divalent metal transporter [Bosea sp. MMO-172]|uniref:Nramp family divalent metal transporter n=1 Tax=Bosea sp. MMO-172 TaxID=3127885 RepID=UPI003FA57BD0